MQFDIQRRSYAMQYPESKHLLIYVEQLPVGRLLLDESSNEEKAIQLIDVSLLPEFRNQGVGTRLLQHLQRLASETLRGIRLSVLQSNPAIRLYERQGFMVTGESVPYLRMHWHPAEGAATQEGDCR